MIRWLCFALIFVSCFSRTKNEKAVETAPANNPVGYQWTKLLDSAEWPKSYNFQMLSLRDTIWTMHSAGNWFSADGIHWNKSSLPNSINNLAFLDYVIFKDAVYGLGYFDGNIETFTYKPTIFRSTNMKSWEKLKEQSNLPGRFFYHPFVFDGKIWIIGGEDKDRKYDDIWNSSDGMNWVRVKGNLPFGARSNSQIVQFNNRLYLLNNDVWSSADGLTWMKECDEIVKGQPIFGYAALVFDQKIFLLGCNRNGQFTSQVLYSEDGKQWKEMDAPWSPRGGIAATVFRDRVYMTGGKYGGTRDMPEFRYSNDVWSLVKSH